MEQWEYKTIAAGTRGFAGGNLNTQEFDLVMNRLGREGWELVSCYSTNRYQGATHMVMATFKRKMKSV